MANDTPETIVREWTTPDCGTCEAYVRTSRGSTLKLRTDSRTLYDIGGAHAGRVYDGCVVVRS